MSVSGRANGKSKVPEEDICLEYWKKSEDILFFPALVRYNWHITLCKLKVYSVVIWYTLRYCKMITAIALANTYIMSYICYFIFVVRTFEIYSLSNFLVYNRGPLTIVTMLYIRGPQPPGRRPVLGTSSWPVRNRATQQEASGWQASEASSVFAAAPQC